MFRDVVSVEVKRGLESQLARRAALLIGHVGVVLRHDVPREIIAFLERFDADRAPVQGQIGVFSDVIVVGVVRFELGGTQLTEELVRLVAHVILQLLGRRKRLLAHAAAERAFAATIANVTARSPSRADVSLLTVDARV